ncbi:TonB-dependent receptor [Stenotrophomonas mori]|uniref:TonB-dependent receptor n=1 Tax=Stenotrophomonas mori TaxID=2871096 RepID=A0ABT0SD61_9GAMM|nr:TonB-dependent receptor [Stenotrophomonas mori]MCL7713246.1 TonB-dependent receptor [Stenotrophomonas mori]
MRFILSPLAASIAATVLALQAAPAAFAQGPAFDVPTQPAASGVRQFAEQAGIQAIISSSDALGRTVNPVHGALDTRLALNELVQGTGLSVRSFDGNVAVLAVDPDGQDAARTGDAPQTLDRMVVTGSRIARPELEQPMPISVVRMDEALRFGNNDLYSVLQQNPAMGIGNSLSSSVTGWDAGASFLNLRNLGTNRSLTLIDGKRRVSASARSSAVDIGTIPLGMIDRVEIVTGGAAAVYGADAVTGAVNIITRKDIEETTLSVTGGMSEQGDAGQRMVSLSSGFKFADGRGRVSLGGTWTRTDPLYMYDRYPWTWQPFNLANPDNTGVDDGIHDNLTLYNYRQHYYAYEPNFWLGTVNGQAINTRYMLESGGTVRPMYHDVYYSSGIAQFATGNGGDGRNLTDHYQLRGGNTNASVMGRAEFDFNENLTWSGWFDYAKTDYAGNYYPWRDDTRTTFFSSQGTAPGGAKAYLDNPFLPDAIRAVMEQHGLTSLSIDRTYGNFPVMTMDHHRRSFTLGTDVSGDLGDYLGWNAFYQYGKVTDRVVDGNLPWKSHWLAARDVISVDGQPVCRSEAARAEGCVPLNIFSTAPASKALVDYVMGDRHEFRETTQQLAGAGISGSAFQLPAGNLQFAAGLEYRRDTLVNRDDPLAVAGELAYGGGIALRSQLDVTTSVREAYVETMAPLLADRAFARRLDVEAAYRYSDYSTVGSTQAWKYGVVWEPLEGLAIRGVKSRSVRTPNFGELYEPISETRQGSIADPCMVGNYHASPTRAANCAASGVPAPFVDPKLGPVTTSGGNPDLRPEVSDSTTIGFVWRPRRNFDLTVDYWNIDIDDVIYTLSYLQIMNLCVDLPSIDNPYCASVTRNHDAQNVNPTVGIALPLGAGVAVNAQTANIARMHARGVDLGANWSVDAGPGRLGLKLAGTYLIKQVLETTPGVPAGDQLVDGAYSSPNLRASLTTTYDVGRFGVALNSRYWGHGKGNVNATSKEQYDNNNVPSRTYYDLSGRYGVGRHVFNLSVNNLLDTKPPQMGFGEPGIYANSSVYDLLGRYYSLNYTFTF